MTFLAICLAIWLAASLVAGPCVGAFIREGQR
jgi:hypothetical protein